MSGGPLDRVVALLDLERDREALVLVQSLLSESPDDAELHCLASRALLGLDEGVEAARAAQRAIAAQPDRDEAHRLRAAGWAAAGFPDIGVGAAREAIRIAPLEPLNHAALAVCLSDHTRGRFEAWEAAEEALRLAPHDPALHLLMADIAAAWPSPETAAWHYRRALELDPGNALALTNLTVLDRPRVGRGLRGYAGALALDPHLAEAQENLDALSLAMLIGAQQVSVLVLVVGLVGAALGAPWLGPAAVGACALAGIVLWRRLPRAFRRSRGPALRRGFGRAPVTLATAGALVTATVLACLTSVVPGELISPVHGVAVLAVAMVLNRWSVTEVRTS